MEDTIDENLESLISTKVLSNLEIDKDERFWEQQACAN